MSVVVTEKWSGKTRTRANNNGDTAQRIFTVIGAASDDDAIAYVGLTSAGYPGIDIGFAYGAGSFLTCNNITSRDISVGVFEVTCSFAIGNFTTPQNPLTLPWKYDWKTVTIEPQFDRDVDGNAIVNSANCPFDPPPTKQVCYKSLRIIRNESFYNYATYKTYENTVNSDTIVLLQPNGQSSTFAPGEIRCCSIEPQAAYTQKDQYVTMVISLEIYDLSIINVQNPHQLHILDKGSMGYWDNGGTNTPGNIWTAPSLNSPKGEQVTADVQLNGKGLPVDTTLTIQGHTPVAYYSGDDLPPGATLENPASNAYYLSYKRYKPVALLPLLTETAA